MILVALDPTHGLVLVIEVWMGDDTKHPNASHDMAQMTFMTTHLSFLSMVSVVDRFAGCFGEELES